MAAATLARKRVRATDSKGRPVQNLYVNPDGHFVGGLTMPGQGWKMRVLKDSSGRYPASLTEAKTLLRLLQSEVDSGTYSPPSEQTFQDVADEFLVIFAGQVKSGEKSERTLDSYRSSLKHRILPELGTKKVQKIGPNDLGKLITQWRAKGLSPQTIRTTLIPCGRILKFAVRRGYISDNPMSKLERDEKPRIQKHEPRILGHSEIKALIEHAPGQYEACITTAVFSGLRVSELLGLRWHDVDFASGLIRVRHQLSRAKKATADEPARIARLVPLKTGAGRRDVILMPQLGERLKQHRTAAFASGLAKPEDYVFATTFGTPTYYRNLSKRGLEEAATDAGINVKGRKKLGMHDLRHTFASYLILELGFDPTRVAEQLGHARASFTLDTYVHLFREANHAEDIRQRMASSQFGALLGAV